MTRNFNATEQLSSLVAGTRWDDLPAPVTHQAKRSLMNFFAVALAGARDPIVETVLASLAEFSGGRQGRLIGRRERLDVLGAAFLNAAGANALDFCDTHTPTAIHPTAPLVPALLALAELRNASGRDLILALVVGQEVACRIGLAMSPGHYTKGWHITATCGVFGAAAACARLMGLEVAQLVWAFGLAATQSSGLCECLGTPAKSIGVGNAARNGLWSAMLAARNFAGPAEPLTGAQGFYNAMGEKPELDCLTERLGETWEILRTSYKPYPCGFVMHPVIDCVVDWRRAHPGVSVEKVVVTGNPLLARRADRPDVSTGREAQVSVQHAVAAALLTGKAGLAEFTDACVRDARVQALRRKVELVRDASLSTVSAAVEIAAADGKTFKLEQQAARGSDANPMTDRELEDKLRAAAAAWNAGHDVEPLIAAIWRADECADISSLTAHTIPRD